MKITNKINLITTAWLLCVLMLFNVVVFVSFIKITVNMEEDALLQKANDIITEIHTGHPGDLAETLKDFLTIHSYIRVVNPDGKILAEVTNDKEISGQIRPKYTSEQETGRILIGTDTGEKQVIYVRVPIKMSGHLRGTLDFGEALMGLEMRKDILLWILGVCTVLSAILSLLGGRWLSGLIMRPISNMIKTMEDIEQSGVPKKIVIQNRTRDELEQMASTFNRMIERLSENMEKQEQFISDASHELKTPITVIKSYASLLRRRGVQNIEMSTEAIEAIYSEANRIQKMTEMFLNIATSEKETTLDVTKVDLISLCKEIQKQLKNAYKREIHLHYNEEHIFIQADELKLKQIVIILLDNAIKYSKDQIDLYLKRDEQRATIVVKDYGIGIPEQDLQRIFERFYRVDKARSRETGGTGLGLAIAKNIMKMHRGEIKIISKEEKGTEVELQFPL
ncbi:two-component sensor histidine kinase [Bacillus sp. MUM 116]|uniref:sensor histidine kinase n=1 Tax=Bacillus sp. MUM 116 TaxID=1678002 RepID=UPI0008F570DE|nr:HAMP domain-containing sensor histidine kinase [Bacillus sp. MUM 116]OIK15699.1 two-component sensor histidine kinase [Bacillus sp. MUM 116]